MTTKDIKRAMFDLDLSNDDLINAKVLSRVTFFKALEGDISKTRVETIGKFIALLKSFGIEFSIDEWYDFMFGNDVFKM